MNRGN